MAHIHFIGIGGAGLSAIARVLLERGQTVSGSDRAASPLADSLARAGARIVIGHAAENIRGAHKVIRSSAIPDDNPEVLAARAAGLPVLKRAEYLPELLKDCRVLAVAGSHGKTTTSAMLAWTLTAMNERPGFIVGGVVENLGVNAATGTSEYFVIEADEYDYMFWGLNPEAAVVTNVEHDHPDMFPTADDFRLAFEGFAERIKPGGLLAANTEDPGAAALLARAAGGDKDTVSYALHGPADFSAADVKSLPGSGYSFRALKGGVLLADVALQAPGEHNVRNALAVLAVVDWLGLDVQEAALALGDFRGAGRRFEVIGEAGGVTVVDDYGHHPTEIRATLSAARARYPGRRLWAVWQPHTYSRTLQLLESFGAAFDHADRVLVTGVYAAREAPPEDFSHDRVLAAIRADQPVFQQRLAEATGYLLAEVRPGDVVLVFSAGDATEVSAGLLAGLQSRAGEGVA
ncbi:MAG: UDP-N-acetylmuramate--L-alanine ligase [Anaerolineae bacterium]|nr:MAG: UDP-N-acetylmuramate--L-alanine ligase [Anaerolineae bacterium]